MSLDLKESVIDFCNAIEAAAVNLRKQIEGKDQGRESPINWNPDKIKWSLAEGAKGPYEKSGDINNLEFKAMLKDLNEHNGKLRCGPWFYWRFENGSTVGRKKVK